MLACWKSPLNQTVFNVIFPVVKQGNHCPHCNRVAEGFVPGVALGSFDTIHLHPYIVAFRTIWVCVEVVHRKLVVAWVIDMNFVFNNSYTRPFVIVIAVPLNGGEEGGRQKEKK